jgi:Ras family protein
VLLSDPKPISKIGKMPVQQDLPLSACDIFVDNDLSHSRQVQPMEGEKLAQQIHAAWVETSAKSNVNVGAYVRWCH